MKIKSTIKHSFVNQGQICFISLFVCFNTGFLLPDKSVACYSIEMARNLHSRKVASLIILLAFWFLVSEVNVNWIRQILGTFLIPLLTPRISKVVQSASTELSTETVEKGFFTRILSIIKKHKNCV